MEKYKNDNEINLTNLVDHKKCVEQLKVDNERLNNDNKQIDFNYKMLSADNGILKDNLKELNENYKNQINVKDEKIDNLMESNNTLIKVFIINIFVHTVKKKLQIFSNSKKDWTILKMFPRYVTF